MKKAFYTLGTIYLAFKVAGYVADFAMEAPRQYRRIKNKAQGVAKQTIRQPIGFAV